MQSLEASPDQDQLILDVESRLGTLPEELFWLAPQLRELVHPAAMLVRDETRVAPMGGTRTWGVPDVPMGAAWASVAQDNLSPYDGDSFWLQLNMEEVPAYARREGWPAVGVVWVFLDLSCRGNSHWRADTYFDPRPAHQIPWRPRPVAHVTTAAKSRPGSAVSASAPAAACWLKRATLPCATEQTLPEIASWRGVNEMYDDWAAEQFMSRRHTRGTAAQVGGWVWPIQGDHDEAFRTVVCAMEDQPFGDSGAMYLHFESSRGFWAEVHTC